MRMHRIGIPRVRFVDSFFRTDILREISTPPIPFPIHASVVPATDYANLHSTRQNCRETIAYA